MPSLPRLTVRLALAADVEAIITFSAAMALETEGRQLDPVRLREGTAALLTSPAHGFFVVAELAHPDPGRLIGQMMITYEWSDWRNGVFWWIQSVYVAPEWRRCGVFRRMHETVVARAKADPTVCGIRLYVEQENRTAQLVYRRVGLVPSAYVVYEQDFVLPRHA
jgi:ribosomal protein S18 acetylase RimI-like enzyme